MKIINNEGIITTKRNIIFLGAFFVLFLVIGSTFAAGLTGSPEKNTLTLHPEISINRHIGESQLGSAFQSNENLPTSYDLRSLNKVTPVKDQGNAGTCWAFATYGSLESSLLPGETWNFSENHMKNILSPAAPEGFDLDFSKYLGNNSESDDHGDVISMSTAYLARWSGPVSTADDPYNASSVYSSSELEIPVQKHVQDVYFIPDRRDSLDNNEIKSAIMKYGAVETSIYVNNAMFFSANNTTVMEGYNSTTYSYYYNGSLNSTHGVDIVGWDDNFDMNKFSPVPPGNGAFIVKNSWGTEFGDDGYFYVSYYDSNIGKHNAVFTTENVNNYQNIYQYDPLGCIGSSGYNDSITAWCANIFTAKSNETLKAVSFYAVNSTCNFELYVYTDLDSGPINQVGPVLIQNGTIPLGYHTVHLDSEVPLKTGRKFSVVLKLTTPQSTNPISVESPISDYSSKAIADPGESFVSPDGNSWTDITTVYPNANVCIKAFTDSDSDLPVQENITQSRPVADFSSDVTSGPAPLTVQFTDDSQNATSRIWDFGDGYNTTDKDPNHTYFEDGTYTVTLTVRNNAGSDKKTSQIIVGSGSSDSGDNSNDNGNNSYNGNGSNDNENNSNDNGNGSTDNETSDNGNSSLDNGNNTTYTVCPCSNLVADFSTCTAVPLKAKFNDKSSGGPISWKWNFGDGTSSTCKNPTHIYCKAGKYTVTLTIKDAEGNTAKKCKCIIISEPTKKHSKNTNKVSKDTKTTCKAKTEVKSSCKT